MTALTSSLFERWQEVASALAAASSLPQVREALRGFGGHVDLRLAGDPLDPNAGPFPDGETIEITLGTAVPGVPLVRLHLPPGTPLTEQDRALLRATGPLICAALTRQPRLEDGRPGQDRESALRAFMLLTERLGADLEPDALIRSAEQGVRQLLPDVTAAYLGRRSGLWKLFSDAHPALLAALRGGQPVFVDHWYGEQRLPGTRAYRAVAAQAFLRDGQIVGLMCVGTTDHDTWTELERGIFTAACRSLHLALSRAWHVQQLAEERAALAAFVSFEEQVTDSRDPAELAGRAAEVLVGALRGVSVAFFGNAGGQWRPVLLPDDLPDGLVAELARGVSMDTPTSRCLMQTRAATFVPDWQAPPDVLSSGHGFMALALHPTYLGSRLVGLLIMGKRAAPDWSERERRVFSAVGRSLSMALDRSANDELLRDQNAALHAQTRSLEAFAQLSADLGAQEDRYALIRRAQEVALSLLADGFAVYYEPEGGLWRLRAQVGSLRDPELQAAVDAGLDFERSLTLLTPWKTGEAYYQDSYDADTDGLRQTEAVVGATACLPLTVRGERTGVFCIAQFHARTWSAADRSLLSSVTQSLSLALDRAQSVMDLRHYSDKLELSNAAMHAANEELEAFAYSVSHDLRAPVRHITGFSDLLRKALGDTLDANPKASRALQVITDSAAHMNELIDAMLNLSRTARQELRVDDVNLAALTEDVRRDLTPDLQGRAIHWNVAPLPTVKGDPTLLRQVLFNLIGNAVKYTSQREQAVIDVWAERRGDDWAVHIRDNGVGFDSRYAHKLFGVFQRLHRPEDFGGTGVGLANVRRILLRHEGTWAATGEPGQGATFTFTLPASGPVLGSRPEPPAAGLPEQPPESAERTEPAR
ncbi:ATP-binding protein [Deinococcus sp.]|uniref:sensor histidine kinase n=1 Tax=Deinococcus sp. TaxID=47478 RepID=UPI0025B987D3|nr:ATP-binding protein [Deinococcus sp.]